MLDWLSAAQDFMPRYKCGKWTETLAVLYQTGNFLILFSYYIIPGALIFAYRKLRVVIEEEHIDALLFLDIISKFFVPFAIFIFFCGTGHLEAIISFYWPNYYVFTAWDWLTGLISLATACGILALPLALKYAARKPHDPRT